MVINGNRVYLPRYRKQYVSEVSTENEMIRPVPKEWRIAMAFKNIGGANARINGLKLDVGDPMMIFDGSADSIDETTYSIEFLGNTNPAVEVTKTVVVDFSIISKELPMAIEI